MGYKLVTYDAGKGPRAGVIVGENLIDAAEGTGNAAYATTLGILERLGERKIPRSRN